MLQKEKKEMEKESVKKGLFSNREQLNNFGWIVSH